MYQYQECSGCGSPKVENRETGLCASCGRAARKEATAKPPPKRKALKSVSAKMGARIVAKVAAYKLVDAASGQCCLACGGREWLTHSHILSVRQHPELEDNPRNLEILCQPCHHFYEHDKQEFKAMYPTVWANQMLILAELAPARLALLQAKHPALYAQ